MVVLRLLLVGPGRGEQIMEMDCPFAQYALSVAMKAQDPTEGIRYVFEVPEGDDCELSFLAGLVCAITSPSSLHIAWGHTTPTFAVAYHTHVQQKPEVRRVLIEPMNPILNPTFSILTQAFISRQADGSSESLEISSIGRTFKN